MDGIKEVGLEFYGNCSTPFPSLKIFRLSCLKSWEKWVHPPVDLLDYKAFSILETLDMYDCPSLQGNLPPLLPSLTTLKIEELKNMERLTGLLLIFTSLSLPEGGLPRNLRSLEIREANIQQAVTEWELHLLHSLKILRLQNVSSSVHFSCPHFSLPSSLSKLQIEGFQHLKTISNCSTLSNLTHLSIGNCPELHNFLEGGLPTNLITLSIRGTKIDKPIKEWGFHLLTSLQCLILINVGSCVDTLEFISYPDFPSSLGILDIEGFQIGIPKLESFGDNGLPPRSYVYIKECDMIEQQLTSDPYGRIKTENGRFSLPP